MINHSIIFRILYTRCASILSNSIEVVHLCLRLAATLMGVAGVVLLKILILICY